MPENNRHSLIRDDAADFLRENFGTERLAPKYGENGLVTDYHEPTLEEIEQAEELNAQFDPKRNSALVSAYRKALRK